MGWAEQEFETIGLGDPRLNRRVVLLAERRGQESGRVRVHSVPLDPCIPASSQA